jgi:hypothetical protein
MPEFLITPLPLLPGLSQFSIGLSGKALSGRESILTTAIGGPPTSLTLPCPAVPHEASRGLLTASLTFCFSLISAYLLYTQQIQRKCHNTCILPEPSVRQVAALSLYEMYMMYAHSPVDQGASNADIEAHKVWY